MRANMIFFVGFLLLAVTLVGIDYVDKKQLNLGDNIFQALFISVLMALMFWLTNRNKNRNNAKE